MKFFLCINVKMPTIVGILISMGRNNSILGLSEPEKKTEFLGILAWAWLAKPKANVVIPKNQPLPKYLRKKTSKSAKYHQPLRYKKKTR